MTVSPRSRPPRSSAPLAEALAAAPGAEHVPVAPASDTCPRSGASTPASSFSSVDLPAPLGPTTPTTSPGATVREMPSRIVWAPWAFATSRAVRTAVDGGTGGGLSSRSGGGLLSFRTGR